MILVTGAAGKTGQAVLKALTRREASVHAVVHRPEQIKIIENFDVDDITVGDLRDPKAMRRAAQGTQAIYHICPNVNLYEVEIGQVMIETAIIAGTDHFVYHSVLHPQVESMPHHWKKMHVEALLFESKMKWTILQPTIYMQNMLGYMDSIISDGVYPVPYNINSQFSMVDLDDVANAAALILTNSGHTGAIYELVGTMPMSSVKIASAISRKLGIQVEAIEISLTRWEQNARASGLSDYQLSALIKMFEYYDKYGMTGSTNVLSYLLSRQPTTFNDFLEQLKEKQIQSYKNRFGSN